ncbi:DUF4258 domain-containing protein [Flavihumibacter stibioxidans]|nr:DUF4258 domain-containing protein [Flavihumibacter stibioxidans]
MRKKQLISALILIILALAILYFRGTLTQTIDNEEFDRQVSDLQYTRHARCRMDCRQITEAEIIDILQNGSLNHRKSDPYDKPCPTYALEGYTRQDRQHVRIVFAQCDNITRVVTCIDLDREFTCNCK